MSANRVYEDYLAFIDKLNKKEPFSFAHFNDGEMRYICGYNTEPISRGSQTYHPQLAKDLTQSLLSNNPEFYRGIPCAHCFPEMNRDTLRLLASTKIKTVTACVFHHTYFEYRELFFKAMKSFDNICWMTNPYFHVENVCRKIGVNFAKSRQIIVPETNAYDYKENLINSAEFKDGELVLLLCGPLGRILAAEAFDKYPKTTFLCLGSYFDYYAFQNPHEYYFKNIECAGCCPPSLNPIVEPWNNEMIE